MLTVKIESIHARFRRKEPFEDHKGERLPFI